MKKTFALKTIALVALVLGVALVLVIYVRNTQHRKALAEAEKLDAERRAVGEKLRAFGRQLAEQERKRPGSVVVDPLAPAAPSDADELAQAKLWHDTPPAQRKKLLPIKPQRAGAEYDDRQ